MVLLRSSADALLVLVGDPPFPRRASTTSILFSGHLHSSAHPGYNNHPICCKGNICRNWIWQMYEYFSSMDIACMANTTYSRYFSDLSKKIEEITWDTFKESEMEETELPELE
ncbi:hypothetical protein FQR65_LT13795 [Abscondita terminalis]|nr:hypothetical protein FQR65_LT13795 [Abscondita terminalis]